MTKMNKALHHMVHYGGMAMQADDRQLRLHGREAGLAFRLNEHYLRDIIFKAVYPVWRYRRVEWPDRIDLLLSGHPGEHFTEIKVWDKEIDLAESRADIAKRVGARRPICYR
jgi:hypothetical protein